MRTLPPLRLRLTAAFAATTTVALVALGVFVYYRVEATLEAQTRTSLDAQLDALRQVPVAGRPAAVRATDKPTYAQVLTENGAVVSSSSQLAGPLLAAGDLPPAADGTVQLERRVHLRGQQEPEDALLLSRRDGGQVLVVGSSREDVADALQGVLTQLLIGGPLVLLAAAAAGYFVAGSALRPIERMRRRAASISAQRSEDRLPLPATHDEVRRLGETLNAMLDRLDEGLRRERRFVAEAGHELRTPLALLRMELDLALSRPRSAEELRDAVRSAGDEVDRLTRLSESLLAVTTAAPAGAAPAAVDVVELLQTVVGRFSASFAAAGRAVTLPLGPPLLVQAERGRLDQAVSNLLDNALRHGTGDITVSAHAGDATVSVLVADEGPGPGDELGSGLGLTIVRAIVERHAGQVSIENREDPPGTVVRIDLPTASGSVP